MFSCEDSCPGDCLFAQVDISDFEGGDELKESSEVKGSLGPMKRFKGVGSLCATNAAIAVGIEAMLHQR